MDLLLCFSFFLQSEICLLFCKCNFYVLLSDSFINKHVCTSLLIHIAISRAVSIAVKSIICKCWRSGRGSEWITSKALALQWGEREMTHSLIIKFKPFIILSCEVVWTLIPVLLYCRITSFCVYKWNIVAMLCWTSLMYYYAN